MFITKKKLREIINEEINHRAMNYYLETPSGETKWADTNIMLDCLLRYLKIESILHKNCIDFKRSVKIK